MGRSKIEWTDKTWSVTTGCTWMSAGCDNCFAERMAKRLQTMGHKKYEHGFDVVEHMGLLEQPFHWRKPCRVFVSSMGDLFHADISDEFVAAVFGTMAANPHLTFQILTKRPLSMIKWFNWLKSRMYSESSLAMGCIKELEKIVGSSVIVASDFDIPIPWPLPNVWLGVTGEDQREVDWRVPSLLKCPAVLHFISCEPMLGPIELQHERGWLEPFFETDPMLNKTPRLNWVICGCESGPSRRYTRKEWVKSLRDQCVTAGTPFFLKQLGGVRPKDKIIKMPELGGSVWGQFPEGIC